MTIGCKNCAKQYTPTRKEQKYCSNTCRTQAWNAQKNAIKTHITNANDMDNINASNETETSSDAKTNAIIERILKEREEVFSAKLKTMELQHEKQILELRLNKLEQKVKDLEDDQGGGIKTADIMTALATYFSMQQKPTPTPTSQAQ
jgi:hypothetical protein